MINLFRIKHCLEYSLVDDDDMYAWMHIFLRVEQGGGNDSIEKGLTSF